jgi:hypothetical protein
VIQGIRKVAALACNDSAVIHEHGGLQMRAANTPTSRQTDSGEFGKGYGGPLIRTGRPSVVREMACQSGNAHPELDSSKAHPDRSGDA